MRGDGQVLTVVLGITLMVQNTLADQIVLLNRSDQT